ncbi:MAG: hypothetical protein HUJ57_02355 [Erysipelotrichaceae bacterium]|nr:hypothetical protein [Erysipelotrichaceae bacterium]
MKRFGRGEDNMIPTGTFAYQRLDIISVVLLVIIVVLAVMGNYEKIAGRPHRDDNDGEN